MRVLLVIPHYFRSIEKPIHSSNNKLNKTFSPVLESERITVSSSNQSSIKEERDNSCEDDDCWPFLCSLSVSI